MAVLELLLLALCLLHRPRATATPHPSVIVVSVEAFNVCMRSSEPLAGLMGSRRFRSCGTAANGFLNCLEFNSTTGNRSSRLACAGLTGRISRMASPASFRVLIRTMSRKYLGGSLNFTFLTYNE